MGSREGQMNHIGCMTEGQPTARAVQSKSFYPSACESSEGELIKAGLGQVSSLEKFCSMNFLCSFWGRLMCSPHGDVRRLLKGTRNRHIIIGASVLWAKARFKANLIIKVWVSVLCS